MKSILVKTPGGPEALELVDLPTPSPRSGQALVRVEAAGVNYVDIYTRSGLYKSELPIALGSEGAGVVEAIGDGVTHVAVGDRVAWAHIAGSYSTHVIAPAERLVHVPEDIDSRVAAATMLQGMTAHYLVHSTYPLRAGETCLQHAAAGGVGLLLSQLAKRLGARVIGTTSTEEKAMLARDAGADEVILYSKADFEVEVRRLTKGRGVDVVYDSVGKATFDQSLRSLRPRGMMVSFGNASGPVPPFSPLLLTSLGSLFFTRPKLGDYIATESELALRAGDILGAIARGELRVRIHAALPLDRAAEAHRMLEARETSGKVLLIP